VLHIVDSEDDEGEGIVGLTALRKADLRFSHSETEKSNSTYVMNRWRRSRSIGTHGGRSIQTRIH
jgi:hypothetical protein